MSVEVAFLVAEVTKTTRYCAPGLRAGGTVKVVATLGSEARSNIDVVSESDRRVHHVIASPT